MRYVFNYEWDQIEEGTKIAVFANNHEPHTFIALEEGDTVEEVKERHASRDEFVAVLEK